MLDDRSTPSAARPPESAPPIRGQERATKARRRQARFVATALALCVAGAIGWVLINRWGDDSRGEPRDGERPQLIEGPAANYTTEENAAWEALHRARQIDAKGSAAAELLIRVALAHGRADRVTEAVAAYAQLFAPSRGLGAAEVRRLDFAEQLAREFRKQGRIAAAQATWDRAYVERRRMFGRRDSFTVEALKNRLETYIDTGSFLAAEALLPELEDGAPLFAFFDSEKRTKERQAFLRQRFELYRSLERPRDAAPALTRLLEAHAPSEWPLYEGDAIEAALLFQQIGDTASAQDVLRRATQGDRADGAHMARKIALAWLSGQSNEHVALENELFDRNPFRPADSARPRSARASQVTAEQLYAETVQALCDLTDFYRRVDQPDAVARITAELGQFTAHAPKISTTHVETMGALGSASRRARDWEEAERHYRGYVAALRQAPKPDLRSLVYALAGQATACLRLNRYAEAIALQREVIKTRATDRGENDWSVLLVTRRLVEFHFASGDLATAETIGTDLLQRTVELHGNDSDYAAHCREQLALIASQRKNFAQASQLLLELIDTEKRRLGPEHPGTLHTLRLLGNLRRDQGQFTAARSLHERGLADLLRVHGIRHRDVSNAFAALAKDHAAEGDFAAAAKVYVEATRQAPHAAAAWNSLAWFRATAPVGTARDGAAALAAAQKACELSAWTDAQCVETLAAAWAETGNFERAVEHQQHAIAQAELTGPERLEWDARLTLYRDGKAYHQPLPRLEAAPK